MEEGKGMSNPNSARRTRPVIEFAGIDITDDILPYLLSVTYVDNEENEADDLTIKLQDREALWLEDWLNEAIEGAAAAKLKIRCSLIRENWTGGGEDITLPAGNLKSAALQPLVRPRLSILKQARLLSAAQCARQRKIRRGNPINCQVLQTNWRAATGFPVCMKHPPTRFISVSNSPKKVILISF